jgi:glycosyltransferase (activator-dependent family)
MRVLFATYSDKSLLLSMVPLAWALRTAGHEVRVASQPELAGDITAAGLTAVPVGRARGTWRLADMDVDTREAEREGLPEPYNAAVLDPAELDWESMRDGYSYHVEQWHKLDNFPMINALAEFARYWRPDLVIWEPSTYAGPIAAKACGAAHGRLLWSIDAFGVTRERYLALSAARPDGDRADPLAAWLAGYGRKYGFDFGEDMVTGQFTIDPLPEPLRMPAAGVRYVPMRYVPYGGPATVPRWVWEPPHRPRVLLTLGITATDCFGGYAVSVQDLLDALSDLDIELVATLAEGERRKLRRVPDNTRVVSYVPLHAIAGSCAAVIDHAGPGTLLTVAREAVPQLTVPWDFDEPELARRLAGQGASLTIRADESSGPLVREALLRLLDEPAFTARAERLRDDIAAMPSPDAVAGQLAELTAGLTAGPVAQPVAGR